MTCGWKVGPGEGLASVNTSKKRSTRTHVAGEFDYKPICQSVSTSGMEDEIINMSNCQKNMYFMVSEISQEACGSGISLPNKNMPVLLCFFYSSEQGTKQTIRMYYRNAPLSFECGIFSALIGRSGRQPGHKIHLYVK